MQTMNDRTVLVTGATAGLGWQVARDLAARGATILLHGRDPDKGETARREIERATGNGALRYCNADLASLDEARRLADAICRDRDRLDILVNNAGVGAGEPGSGRALSRDGHELRFAVNYLAHFLLTRRLLPLLRQAAPARIVNVASAGQQAIDFDDVMLERGYSGWRAYSQSKLAQILFTFDLAGRLDGTGVTVNALHPATLMDTAMVREARVTPSNVVREGAEAVEYLATSPDLDGVTGQYFDGKRRARADVQASDEGARRRLVRLSEELTGAA